MADPWNRVVNLADELNRDLAEFVEADLVREHARIARRQRDGVIAESDVKPGYETIVDGRTGAQEEAVKPFGTIAYRFQYWGDVARFALDQARSLSPADSGRYRDSWFVLADGVPSTPETIPFNAREVAVVNDQPYHRKIEVGGQTVRAPGQNKIIETVRGMINRQYGNSVTATVRFMHLNASGSGRASVVPWIAKSKKASVDATGRTTVGTQEVTYPAVIILPIGGR